MISLSWRIPPSDARALLPSKVLQGNLDPCALYGGEKVVDKKVREMMAEFGKERYIANLGHGMMPDMTPDMAASFIRAVRKN